MEGVWLGAFATESIGCCEAPAQRAANTIQSSNDLIPANRRCNRRCLLLRGTNENLGYGLLSCASVLLTMDRGNLTRTLLPNASKVQPKNADLISAQIG